MEGETLFKAQASFLGVKSRGFRQIRGNGELVITRDGIRFTRLLPRAELSIPREAIISVGRTRSFLGKTVFRPLAKVVFYNHQGQTDEVAWFVKDLEGLEEAVRSLGIPTD